ncbi:hypothetical protein [Pseudoalteromonas denitrificans]|uniref:Uncharacterized protein n=1 Tax=Pseudoalteromonas denitrificans DSM 6059 TaxID=1123010 RepID=A0A1I1I733_9GAMM|nr:hypothetical protein [Pseudoalteromonas denitrificans]SFC31845.1 hypothetical protein SAMN02745724_01403 [Pseudoalteromonas denitrificans DSM 6059]
MKKYTDKMALNWEKMSSNGLLKYQIKMTLLFVGSWLLGLLPLTYLGHIGSDLEPHTLHQWIDWLIVEASPIVLIWLVIGPYVAKQMWYKKESAYDKHLKKENL